MPSPPPTKRFLPQPVEESARISRRFKVEPVEQSTRSNRPVTSVAAGGATEATDFALAAQSSSPAKRRFLPEPVETTTRSSSARPAPELTPEPSPKEPRDPAARHTTRRFSPQLIETSFRHKKQGQSTPATLPTDKTDITPGTNHIYQPQRRPKRPSALSLLAPENTPVNSADGIVRSIPPRIPRREGSMRPHPNTRRSTRSNSYIPTLTPLVSTGETASEDSQDESDMEYDEDMTPSLSGSIISSEDSARIQLARTRESCDDRFSGYLLALAAEAARKQLREQAEAAFPNSDFHDPIEHFYDRELETGSDDESVQIGLLPHEILDRQSTRQDSEVGWAQKEMQDHLETLALQREHDTNQKIADEATKPTFNDPFWTNGMTAKLGIPKGPVDKAKQAELDRMRNAASPPMLGNDLVFRRCPSPKHSMFETDQKFEVKPAHSENGGLWGGYCVADEADQYITPTLHKAPMVMSTPAIERDDPFAMAFKDDLPKSQQADRSHQVEPQGLWVKRPDFVRQKTGVMMLSGIDDRLKKAAKTSKLEASLQEEFNDEFITQVFNYLSLGYPALARLYDEEISRITKVPESELAKEDKLDARGHIGSPEGIAKHRNGGHGNDDLLDEVTVETPDIGSIEVGDMKATGGKSAAPFLGHKYCPRWHALKLYIVEWGRQNPSLDDSALGPNAWGVRARRGSWAI